MSFRNERNLYRRNCDASGKSIISMYSPDKEYKVFSQDEWWSDNWNPKDYAKEFDFSRSFFAQFDELLKEVPRLALSNTDTVNSEFNNYIIGAKDCFMSFRTFYWCEKILYSYWILNDSKDCVDCSFVFSSQNLYECIDVYRCNSCLYLQNCEDCTDCLYGFDLKWCQDCLLCYNLINKKYCILNKQYSKEDYNIKKNELLKDPDLLMKQKDEVLWKAIKRNLIITNSENSSWDFLSWCKNCEHSFATTNSEDCRYVIDGVNVKSSMDAIWIWFTERAYEGITVSRSSQALFCDFVVDTQNLLYCDSCNTNSHDLFWCVWMRNASYCILNKQYTKEEYEILVPKIIDHMTKTEEWWEFFPMRISPFWYNETVAMEHFPTKNNESKDYKWSNYEAPMPKVEKIIPWSKLPNNIAEIPDDIVNWAIECEITHKPFRIIKQELEFYRTHNLPVPTIHPDQRHLVRMRKRNPRKLHKGTCSNCSKEIETTFENNSQNKVFCEDCYLVNRDSIINC